LAASRKPAVVSAMSDLSFALREWKSIAYRR